MRRIIIPLLALILAAACGPAAVAEPRRPSPVLPMPVGTPPRPAGTVADWDEPIRICAIQQGELALVPVRYVIATRDTTMLDGSPFSSGVPLTGEYAMVAGWFVERDTISFRGRPYVQYGLTRVLGVNEVARVGEYDGVGVYADAQDTASAARIVYLPTRPGCEFQPYEAVGREVDDG
jgi:hypothetical protein